MNTKFYQCIKIHGQRTGPVGTCRATLAIGLTMSQACESDTECCQTKRVAVLVQCSLCISTCSPWFEASCK